MCLTWHRNLKGNKMTTHIDMPVTREISDLFLRYGVDPYQHQGLVSALMRYVYDEQALAAHEARVAEQAAMNKMIDTEQLTRKNT